MSEESPSWSEEEDQPWSESGIELDDDNFGSPPPSEITSLHLLNRKLEQSPTQTQKKHVLESNRNSRNVLGTDKRSGSESASISNSDMLSDLTSKQEEIPTTSPPQDKSTVKVKHNPSVDDKEKERPLPISSPLSYVDSKELDTSDEEAPFETSRSHAVEAKVVTFPLEPETEDINDLLPKEAQAQELNIPNSVDHEHTAGVSTDETVNEEKVKVTDSDEPVEEVRLSSDLIENGHAVEQETQTEEIKKLVQEITEDNQTDTTDCKNIYSSHKKDELIAKIEVLEARLGETEAERDTVRDQLEGFLSKISSMKAVFKNFKETQEELESVKTALSSACEDLSLSDAKAQELEKELEKMKERNAQLSKENATISAENSRLAAKFTTLNTESSGLNSECDRLSQHLTTMEREFQSREYALQDEKYALENEVSKLNKRLSEQKAAFSELEVANEEVTMAQKNLELVVEELRGSLDEKEQLFEEYKAKISNENDLSRTKMDELQEAVADGEKEIEELMAKIKLLQSSKQNLLEEKERLEAEREQYKTENESIGALKEEVQSKVVIIGKLRHEAIILNEHLTKSLSMLRNQLNEGEARVDKELVSNLFINFLQLPRGDSKKFEALQLISGFLNWDELRKMQAGLTNRASTERGDERPGRLSFVSLWTDFLDKESSKK